MAVVNAVAAVLKAIVNVRFKVHYIRSWPPISETPRSQARLRLIARVLAKSINHINTARCFFFKSHMPTFDRIDFTDLVCFSLDRVSSPSSPPSSAALLAVEQDVVGIRVRSDRHIRAQQSECRRTEARCDGKHTRKEKGQSWIKLHATILRVRRNGCDPFGGC
jgi:hypothetical protein